MSDFSRFRTAVGGFSRTDVVNYIEETSAAHQKALRKLEDEKQAFADENDHLLAENTRLQAELSDLRAEHEKLKEEDSALSAQVVSLSDEASELAAQLETAKQELAQLKLEQSEQAASEAPGEEDDAETEPEQPEAATPVDFSQQELAAYRRAEQAERNAMVRARKLREQLSLLCEQSKDRYTDAGEEISALTADLSSGLSRLQETLADIQAIFDDAENAFDELQLPDDDEI